MKTIYSVSVIAAALLFFASCQKVNLVSDNQQPVLRTITASFENSGTKTTLGEYDIPLWKEGDVIRLLDATTHDNIILTSEMINGSSVTFPTKLTGETLYAVYPASATAMDKCTEGSITFAIPVVQDGTFGSANICVAKGDSDDNDIVNLVFSNATAVLEFSQNNPSSTGVIRVAVDAAEYIAGTFTATFGEDNKATVTASGFTTKTIFTKAFSTPEDKYYVAVAPGVATGEVNFKYYTALKEASSTKSSATLAKNTIYTFSIPDSDDDYKPSYVEIAADYDNDPSTPDTKLRWAKMNIGSTKPEGPGHYFAWGYTDGCIRNSCDNGWVLASDNSTEKKFNTTDFKNKTEQEFLDAAKANWGDSWQTPKLEELDALKKATFWAWDVEDNGCYVFSPVASYGAGEQANSVPTELNKNNALMFLHATGLANGNNISYISISDTKIYSYYQSKDQSDASRSKALTLTYDVSASTFGTNYSGNANKYMGCTIRPVSVISN